MTNKDFVNLYKLSKVGLKNSLNKKCLCEQEVSLDEKVCPKCKEKLLNSKLINVNKNSSLAKRIEMVDGPICSFKVYELYSKGFDLYENLFLEFTINTKTLEVIISNEKAFKNIFKYDEFYGFLSKNLPGFYEYVQDCLKVVGGSFVASNFEGLSANYLSNILNIYVNYSAIMHHLNGTKVLYFGNKVDLKDYLDIDYTSEVAVKKSGLLLPLLKSWDIKNVAYFKSIVDISNSSNNVLKTQICDIADFMYSKILRTSSIYYISEELSKYFSIFSLLYNNEISLEDFIRLYNTSNNDLFENIIDYRSLYKKHISKNIDWSSINRITEKNFGSLCSKENLRKSKVSKKDIDKIYSELEKNPLKALENLVKEE